MSQSTPWRPQPPSISDPARGEADVSELGEEADAIAVEDGQSEDGSTQPDWLKRAKDSYRFSTSYIDSNYRNKWDDSIRAFNSQHPSGSKYNSDLFKKRSNLFRPKTRAIIRKNEAAGAAAFFSNMDLIDVEAGNGGDKAQVVSAEVTKQLLQYRLHKTIPWFQVVTGALQDGQVQGACIAHVYWKFLERHGKQGQMESLEDKPCVDLRPIENIRIDPSADWMDPINTSPYLIDMMPMYWCDVKDRMEHPNPKGQRWKKYSAAQAFAKSDSDDDSTRQARSQLQQDPTQQKRDVSDYDIVWVHRHIHKWNGEDYQFYMINSLLMLTDPEPLKTTVWHGQRPYVLGKVVIETHKCYPTSVPQLVRNLQEEANNIQNQRMDNVLFVLNKGYIAKRGRNVDLSALVRNVPGRVVLADDPEGDIKEQTWPDVTQSSYLEQDRIDGDFSDLVGNFNPMQVQAQRTGRESTNTMRMLQGPTNLLTEYMLKTFVETFIQPVLRQLVMLEQHYETDMTILNLAGEKAKVYQKYGVQQMTDAVLDAELTVTVNVGMGATDPVMKGQKFTQALMTYKNLVMKGIPPGVDMGEVFKELMALAGYQQGERFKLDGQDPTIAALQQQIQQLTASIGPLKMQVKDKHEGNVVKLTTAREKNVTELAKMDKKHVSEARQMIVEHLMEMERADTQREGEVEDRDFGAAKEMTMAKDANKAKTSGAKQV